MGRGTADGAGDSALGLPTVARHAAEFGTAEAELLGAALPIAGMAGDQQAALIARPASRRA